MNEELKLVISTEMEKFATAMKDMIEALNSMTEAIKGADEELEKTEKQVKTFKDKVKDAADDAKKNWQNAGTAIKDGIKKGIDGAVNAVKTGAKFMAGALATVATAVIGLVGATEEYRQNQAKLNTSFTEAGYSADVAKTAYNDLYRVLGDDGQATEAAQHLSLLGLSTQELEGLTYSLQGVYAQFGDSLPIEGLTEAINHTAQLGEVQGPLADALEWVGITTDDFNEKLAKCDDETERAQLIASTLSGEYDGLAASYEEANANVMAQREAQANLQSTLASVADSLAPLVTGFTNLANEALAYVMPYIQQFAETYGPMIVPFIQQLAETYLPMLKDALIQVADYAGQAISWVVDNWEIIAAIAGVITGIAVAIGIYNAVAAIKAAMAAAEVTTVWGLVAAYAAQAAAMLLAIAPYVLIVAGIALVVAAIIWCIKHIDLIGETFKNVANWIGETFSKLVDKVKENLKSWVESIKAKFNEIKTNITTAIQTAKDNVVNKFNEIKSNVTDKINAVKTSITTVFTNIKSTITEKITAAKTSVLSIFESIKTGIQTKINNAKTIVNNAIEAIKGFFDFEWSLPSIKLPHFSISGSFSLNPPSIPKFSVSWYEMGGVFDNPTLFPYGNGSVGGLGENGAEAIVPLEKNTKWLERMADMVAERQGKTPIILNVDGKTFAQTSIDSINALTRQTGKLTLNLV